MTHDEQPEGDEPKQTFSTAEVKAIIASLQTVQPTFRLLTRVQAAQYVQAIGKKSCSAKSLANLASEGKGPPYITLGNETFYLPSDIDDWILAKRVNPKTRNSAK